MKRSIALILPLILLLTLVFAGCVIAGDCQHIDNNDNGKCDMCGISVLVDLQLFAVNDLHGKFSQTDSTNGVARMSTYIKNIRKDNNVILLGSGDLWQGGLESVLTKGAIVNDWMNDMDFDSMTIGNHEYDWGEEIIIANAEGAGFPYLGINIFSKATNQRVEYCSPSVVVEKGNVSIGIIGAVGDVYSSISADRSKDVYFKTGSELTELVKQESTRLRDDGVDFVIYSIHDGYGSSTSSDTVSTSDLSSYYDIVLSDGYVDIVFEGHTHQTYAMQDVQGVYHLQGGGDNRAMSHAEISINSVTNSYTVRDASVVRHSVYNDTAIASDPIVEQLKVKYKDDIDFATDVLGYNSSYKSGDALRQKVADLYYSYGVDKWKDYNIVLGGGYISVRNPYKLERGNVTYAMLCSLFPFDNALVLCSIKGSDLDRQFINTDNSNYFLGYGEYGLSVKDNIIYSETYYIVTDVYSSSYAPNNLTVIDQKDYDIYARDLLGVHIAKGGFDTSSSSR